MSTVFRLGDVKIKKWFITHMTEPIWKTVIRRNMEKRGMNMTQLSRAIGRNDTYMREILKRDKIPSVENYLEIMKALKVSLADAFSDQSVIKTAKDGSPPKPVDTVHSVPVYADAAGGRWLEDDSMEEMAFAPTIPAISSSWLKPEHQYARKVEGNSVSRRIRSGEYAIMVLYEHFAGLIPNDVLVDVKRVGADGKVENSIKVFRDNKLFTDSLELEEQQELEMDNGEDGTSASITGVVIAAHRPLA